MIYTKARAEEIAVDGAKLLGFDYLEKFMVDCFLEVSWTAFSGRIEARPLEHEAIEVDSPWPLQFYYMFIFHDQAE